jgi:hypothetical protein
MNVQRAFGGDRFCVKSPCNFSVINYTEIVHLFYKGNVPSFQCKMSPDRSTSVREVDGLSLILVLTTSLFQ